MLSKSKVDACYAEKKITKAYKKNQTGGYRTGGMWERGGGAPPVLDPHLINELITSHGWNIAHPQGHGPTVYNGHLRGSIKTKLTLILNLICSHSPQSIY